MAKTMGKLRMSQEGGTGVVVKRGHDSVGGGLHPSSAAAYHDRYLSELFAERLKPFMQVLLNCSRLLSQGAFGCPKELLLKSCSSLLHSNLCQISSW
ncbi:hypothetical protein R1flu_014009 [Riccia fluitans]|uniref:Uncharacterized protein n=1 Tax=Riccia fluitans TaxID=41844 RepID=A0ABD1YF07_9MARC